MCRLFICVCVLLLGMSSQAGITKFLGPEGFKGRGLECGAGDLIAVYGLNGKGVQGVGDLSSLLRFQWLGVYMLY